MRFAYERLNSLLHTLEVVDVVSVFSSVLTWEDSYTPISIISDFATLVSTYANGFQILIGWLHCVTFNLLQEPTGDGESSLHKNVLELCCLDASLAMQPVFNRFQSVWSRVFFLTSRWSSPPALSAPSQCTRGFSTSLPWPKGCSLQTNTDDCSFDISLSRNVICPLIVTRGSDQMPMSSEYHARSEPSTLRNYGLLIVGFGSLSLSPSQIELARCVPDGVVCFFTSYAFMEDVVRHWNDQGILNVI